MSALHYDLTPTFGALFIGFAFSAVLWGVSSVQVYNYSRGFPKDHWLLKCVVWATWIFDTVEQVFLAHAMWYFLIANFNNPFGLLESTWSLDLTRMMSAFISVIVQIHFAIQIYKISFGNWFISGLIVLLGLTFFTFQLYLTKMALQIKFFATAAHMATASFGIAGLLCGVLCDVLITSGLIWFLNTARTGAKTTNTIIDRILITAINRGLITTTLTITEFILFFKLPGTFAYLAIHAVISKFYAISFFASLNARTEYRSRGGNVVYGEDLELSWAARTGSGNNHGTSSQPPVSKIRFAPFKSSTMVSSNMSSGDIEFRGIKSCGTTDGTHVGGGGSWNDQKATTISIDRDFESPRKDKDVHDKKKLPAAPSSGSVY